MLNFMAPRAIKYHKKLGDSNSEIARKTAHHRKTVAKVLTQPLEMEVSPNRQSSVAVFETQLQKWLDQKLQVKRMLELAQETPTQPYTGKPTAFYDYLRKARLTRQLKARQVAVRFEAMAGEFLQFKSTGVNGGIFLLAEKVGKARPAISSPLVSTIPASCSYALKRIWSRKPWGAVW
jgi:hypothetical protein